MNAFRLGIIAAAVRIAAGGGGGSSTVDPMFSDTLLLLHGDSGTVLDSSSFARTATVSGSITNSTAVTGYFGAAQLLIATGASATWSGLRFTTDGTYTFECFIRIPSHGSPRSHIFGSWSGSQGWTFDIDNGGNGQLAINGALASTSGAVALNPNTRYHIALVLTIAAGSTTASYYVNGALATTFTGSTISSRNSTSSTFDLRLGNRSDNSLDLTGYVEEFRVTRGARYTGAFTVPSAAFPDAGPTLALTAGTGITLSNANQTGVSTSAWVPSPVTTVIPSTGKWFVEFDVTGASGAAMVGVAQSSAVQANFPGGFTNSVSNGDQFRNGGGIFTTVTAGDLTSTGTRFGVSVDQSTGRIRWYSNGTLQAPEVSFTPGMSGLYFALGLFAGRGSVTLRAGSANTPSGFTYLGA